jgi:hypothetical protein
MSWENSCVTFLKGINGYITGDMVLPGRKRYSVQADKDDSSARYVVFEETGGFDGSIPTPMP